MKWVSLNIVNYHQFKDFDLLLTYPEGHPKAKKPLDQICFIGQTGTGKTTILRLLFIIGKLIVGNKNELNELELENGSIIKGQIDLDGTIFSIEVRYEDSKPKITFFKAGVEINIADLHQHFLSAPLNSKTLFFPAEMQEVFNVFIGESNYAIKSKIKNIQAEIDSLFLNKQTQVNNCIQSIVQSVRQFMPALPPNLQPLINNINNISNTIAQQYQIYLTSLKSTDPIQIRNSYPNLRVTILSLVQQLVQQAVGITNQLSQSKSPLVTKVDDLYDLIDSLLFAIVKVPKEFTEHYQRVFANVDNRLTEMFPSVSISDRAINFSNFNPEDLWHDLISDVISYRKQRMLKSSKLTDILNIHSPDSSEFRQELEEFKKWESENPNPLINIAEECLNPLLSRFMVKVRTEQDLDDFEKINYIQLESFDGQIIPHNLFSTGTKQIILTVLPLYKLQAMDSVILFDEPERSLYPDMQFILIDYYTKKISALRNQWFFATHSPIVAAAFEPWEIVELRFNSEGKVEREKYYKNSNKVENYFIYPKYLEWNSILDKVFDFKEKGNPDRLLKLERLIYLRKRIENPQSTATPEDLAEIKTEYFELAKLLDWPLNEAHK